MPDRTDSTPPDYPVGYGRPPKATQFKPGKSGNPRGRPKGSRSPQAAFQHIINETVPVTEKGRTRRMTRDDVISRRLTDDAMRGDHKSRKQYFERRDLYAPDASNAETRTVIVLPSNGREAPGTVPEGRPFYEDVVSSKRR
jgi:hypothetical protein